MERSRLYWGTVLLAGTLAGGGVLFARLAPVLGAAGLAATLLAREYAFRRDLQTVTTGLAVDVTLLQQRATVGDTVDVTLTADRTDTTGHRLTLSLDPPVALGLADGDSSVTVDAGETAATASFSLDCQVAGRFGVERPTATVESPLFAATRAVGSGAELTVTTRETVPVHVGEGGVASGLGAEGTSGSTSNTGLLPVDVREYMLGDAARHIDWRATARLGDPQVREYEMEVEEAVVLVVDHSSAVTTGEGEATQLAYLRQVALAFAESADVPLALVTVGDEGITTHLRAARGREHYARVRDRLETLTPTDGGRRFTTTGGATDLGRVRHRLAGSDTAYAEQVAPFLADRTTYTQQFASNSLSQAVRAALADRQGGWLVVCTDDSRREELLAVARTATTRADRTSLFLTPDALFGPDPLGEFRQTYAAYEDFERFRQRLAGLDAIDAYEVAPQDRIDRIYARPAADRRESKP